MAGTTASTPFRFGVTASDPHDVSSWTSRARRFESQGYATLLMPEAASSAAPLPALAAAAAATHELHVGTWVLCAPLRTPQQIVWDARTMHDLFGDRIELGLGAGRPGAEHDAAALGIPYGTAAERVEHLTTTVELLGRELPALSLLVAASGPRMLRLAGRVADTVALGWPPHTDTAAARIAVDAVRAGAEGRPTAPELATGLIAVGDTGAPWLQRMNTTVDELAAAGAVTVLTGTERQMADDLRRRRDELGITYWTVPEQAATAFAPVLELLTA